LQKLRQNIDSYIFEAAWNEDLTQMRHNLAINTGIFRFMNGEWRRSKSLSRTMLRDTTQPIQAQIEILDNLIKAQALRKSITQASEFGRNAFGPLWRGEHSNSDSLQALVNWMATLKDVGPEARRLASQLSDRETIKHLGYQLRQTLDQANLELNHLWKSFGTSPDAWFDNHYSISRVPISFTEALVQKLVNIDITSRQIMTTPADHISDRLTLVEKDNCSSISESGNRITKSAW
jgi:hypothetical protein